MSVVGLFIVFLFPSFAWPHVQNLGKHVVETYKLNEPAQIVIDGRLDEPAWTAAQGANGLRQLTPNRGAPATDDTEFYILYDRYNLYVGFRCYDSEPQKIINRIGRREEIYSSDWISFFIDPHHDHRTGYKFATTPGGIQLDAYRYDDSSSDSNWRGIWWVECHIGDDGWTAEFKIPFANFRLPDLEKQIWGFDIERLNKRKREVSIWKQMSQAGRTTRMSDLGHVASFSNIESGKLFEITPYTLAGAAKTGEQTRDSQSAMGLDVQYNLSGSFKINATVNPDFAQVEADLTEINLTRFPTRVIEKRPFFVEGNSFFDTPIDLFFSRRIGSRGNIIWGGKMTGKVGKYSVGLLSSQTGNAGPLDWGSGPEFSESALYSAFRVKRDVLRQSNVGIVYVGKELNDSYSRISGIDAAFSLPKNYKIQGQHAMSFNSEQGSNNNAVRFELSQRNFLWNAAVGFQRTDPLFEINQTGFLNKEPFRGWQNIYIRGNFGPRWGPHRVFAQGNVEVGKHLYDRRYFEEWINNQSSLLITPDFHENLFLWNGRAETGIELTESFLNSISIFLERSHEIEPSRIYDANVMGFRLSSNSSRAITMNVGGHIGDYFNFSKQSVGLQRRLYAMSTVRPKSNAAIDFATAIAKTYTENDKRDGRFFVNSLRATYLFTRNKYLRVFAESNRQLLFGEQKKDTTNRLLSILFGWEYRPKSHLFIAFNEKWNQEQFANRVILLKISYVANI